MKRKIKKILIANRGEIAVRIIRACKELGIKTVAIFSEVDRRSLHLQLAHEAYNVGPALPAESYLAMEKILKIAKKAQCDAVHPGYGFLAENPWFVELLVDNGIIFIGPPVKTIQTMGDKIQARKLMQKVGVPIVPGVEKTVTDEHEAKKIAKQLGYPVLIKAAAGGGGRGMRIVHKGKEFQSLLRAAKSEAKAAFGDERIFLEKYLEQPRHIEFQILADAYGNVIHLGERECSIQRRHQKVIEESPSVVLDEELRHKMGEAAVKAAQACRYVNAGTIEFLVDKQKKFYFLEMNTRIQVEHPVTEMVTGIDLVKEQIRIACGERLKFKQDEIQHNGHALECRIYAEEPENNFLPSIGKIVRLKPSHGFGIREDSGIEEGEEISLYYDPMISKLIAWGKNRKEAIQRMSRALYEYQIIGVKTTIPFCLFVLQHPKFVEGKFDTQFVEEYFSQDSLKNRHQQYNIVAAICSVLYDFHQRKPSASRRILLNGQAKSNWKTKRVETFSS